MFSMESGFAADGVLKALSGEYVGTLFHRDAHLWDLKKTETAREMAISARNASRKLQVTLLISYRCWINDVQL